MLFGLASLVDFWNSWIVRHGFAFGFFGFATRLDFWIAALLDSAAPVGLLDLHSLQTVSYMNALYSAQT
ncbi:MAG: hypothetical protein AB8B56_20700 [Crocinitomicaceae bacterium]